MGQVRQLSLGKNEKIEEREDTRPTWTQTEPLRLWHVPPEGVALVDGRLLALLSLAISLCRCVPLSSWGWVLGEAVGYQGEEGDEAVRALLGAHQEGREGEAAPAEAPGPAVDAAAPTGEGTGLLGES